MLNKYNNKLIYNVALIFPIVMMAGGHRVSFSRSDGAQEKVAKLVYKHVEYVNNLFRL